LHKVSRVYYDKSHPEGGRSNETIIHCAFPQPVIFLASREHEIDESILEVEFSKSFYPDSAQVLDEQEIPTVTRPVSGPEQFAVCDWSLDCLGPDDLPSCTGRCLFLLLFADHAID
jgi:hypothetical protein